MTVLVNEENLQQEHDVSIENLRIIYSSCFTCGVSWHEEHVSLDCAECGGYAMSRPCPDCNGRCQSKWTRNLPVSHESQKAAWDGSCSSSSSESTSSSSASVTTTTTTTSSSHQSSSCFFHQNPSQETSSFKSLHKPSKILSVS